VSRVFVSSAYRDRVVGQRVSGLLRDLGDEPVDDRDRVSGTAWWNEVVGRIETCELFVAVVSPAYADAHACRLAAKHAAARGLPVVRLEVDDRAPLDGLHPVVQAAPPVRFDPDDPGAPGVLDRALDEAWSPGRAPAPRPEDPREAQPQDVVPSVAPPALRAPGSPGSGGEGTIRGRLTTLEVALVSAMVVVAGALVVVVGPAVWRLADRVGDDGSGAGAGPSGGQAPNGAAATEPTPSAPSESASGGPDARELLSTVAAVGSALLPATSCTAGEADVICRRPAANLQTVVLTAYPSQADLYDAYTDAVDALSGEDRPENVGDCSGSEFEGELTWDLDLGHGRDVTVDQQSEGGLDPAEEAAGRLFCTESSDVVRLVWTQDPGLLVTATGQPARLTIGWWHEVHLDLACAAGVGTGLGCEDR